MSFNRRGPDRRPDRPDRSDRDRHDRPDRPPQRGGDWQPRGRPGGDRPYQPRPSGDRPYQPRPGGDRPYQGRPPGGDRPFTPRPGGDRPYQQRPRFDRPPDEGGMSIRLDPRRVNALKHLAGEAGVRPGDLVRQWVEERIDASRPGADAASTPAASVAGPGLASRIEALETRIEALESGGRSRTPRKGSAEPAAQAPAEETPNVEPADEGVTEQDSPQAAAPKRARKRASAAPSTERVALHDEMIEVLRERGPMRAADLAEAIVERGRYQVPRSGKPLDAKTVSQRVSNPTYRARFVRNEGLIGLAES